MRKPDFVILDLILPGESGFEVCSRMKQANSTIPVLVLTAIDLPEARALADRVGADDYLTKPFDPDELVKRIQKSPCERGRRHTTIKARTTNASASHAGAGSGLRSAPSIVAK